MKEKAAVEKVAKGAKSSNDLKNLYKDRIISRHFDQTKNPTYAKTHIPKRGRVMVVGGSGTGKTHAWAHYLALSPREFEHIVIVNRGIEEPIYEEVKEQLGKQGRVTFFTLDTLPDVQTLYNNRQDEKDEYLIVFDDLITELSTNKKLCKRVEAYFTVGRKLNMTSWFLTQSYYEAPKTIRLNTSHLILLNLGNDRDLKMVLNDNSLGVTKEQLLKMHRQATERPMQFLKIETSQPNVETHFERNFTDPFIVTEHILEDGTVERTVKPGPWYVPLVPPPKKGRPKRQLEQIGSDSEIDDEEEENSPPQKKKRHK